MTWDGCVSIGHHFLAATAAYGGGGWMRQQFFDRGGPPHLAGAVNRRGRTDAGKRVNVRPKPDPILEAHVNLLIAIINRARGDAREWLDELRQSFSN
jgi:hypothetical protein